jgi:glycosyltransferase involved in cell wall biosynthesis
MKKTISIVLSLYNEEQGILRFWAALNAELEKLSSVNFELIWVNDGSGDRTQLFINDITTDFFLISRQVAEHLKSNYREQSRFIRGYLQDIGFTAEILPFHAPCRLCGESKYSYLKLFGHALNAVFAFSNKPLRISMYCSGIFLLFTLLFGVYTLYMYLYGDSPPSGYTSIILLLLISFSMLFLVITVLSLYFEKAIKEMRQRPIYIIRDVKYSSGIKKHRNLSSVTKSVLKKNSIATGAQNMAHSY